MYQSTSLPVAPPQTAIQTRSLLRSYQLHFSLLMPFPVQYGLSISFESVRVIWLVILATFPGESWAKRQLLRPGYYSLAEATVVPGTTMALVLTQERNPR